MIKVTNNKNKLSFELPGNKSEINRLLILGSIHPSPIRLLNVNFCTDVLKMIEVLEVVGVKFKIKDKELIILNSLTKDQNKNKVFQINLGDGGTTIRFLMSLFAYIGGEYELDVDDHFRHRPNIELFESLEQLGSKFSGYLFPVKMKGQITQKEVSVNCEKSSQYYSSLLLITSAIDLKIEPLNLNNSLAYVEQTKDLIKKIKNGRTEFRISSDASSFSYAFAYNKLVAKVNIKNLLKDEIQSDWKILELEDSNGFNIDVSQCLDLFPTLAFLAAYSEGESKIYGIANLKFKESDRLTETCKLLDLFKVEWKLEADHLKILGTKELLDNKVEYYAPQDHRMIMTAFLFMKKNKGGIIHNEQCVTKSYPHFFEDFKGDQ